MDPSELHTIFYVEDEPDIQTIARIALENVGGLKLHLCDNGLQALDEIDAVQPQLILLDVMMPGIDGPTTLRRLRELPGYQDIPVIFMTAKAQPSEVQCFKKLGALDVILKPFNPLTLAEEVRAIWARHLG